MTGHWLRSGYPGSRADVVKLFKWLLFVDYSNVRIKLEN